MRIVALFCVNLFLFFCLSIRFFGIALPIGNDYFSYKKLAKQNLDELVHAVIIIPGKKIEIIKIFKKPVGSIVVDGHLRAIDSYGQLFYHPKASELIKIEGEYQKWPKIFEQLQYTDIIDAIFHVRIFDFHTEFWLKPGVKILLLNHAQNSVKDANEFIKMYPEFVKSGTNIDIRNTKRITVNQVKSLN